MHVEQFDLHKELLYLIKSALRGGARQDPGVRIEMPFDLITFNGGLKMMDTPKYERRGVLVYGLKMYQDLCPFLGQDWHIQIVHRRGDFNYIHLHSLSFHLHKRSEYKDGKEVEVVSGRFVPGIQIC